MHLRGALLSCKASGETGPRSSTHLPLLLPTAAGTPQLPRQDLISPSTSRTRLSESTHAFSQAFLLSLFLPKGERGWAATAVTMVTQWDKTLRYQGFVPWGRWRSLRALGVWGRAAEMHPGCPHPNLATPDFPCTLPCCRFNASSGQNSAWGTQSRWRSTARAARRGAGWQPQVMSPAPAHPSSASPLCSSLHAIL